MKKIILHLHGFASSGQSAKALYLRQRLADCPGVEFLVPDFNPTPTDFEFLTVTGMINRLRQYILDRDLGSISISASSLGSLVALHYARRFGGVKKLLLLAPVLSYSSLPFPDELFTAWEKEGSIKVPHFGFKEELALRYDFHRDGISYAAPGSSPAPVRILHGINDATIKIQSSRDYAAAYPDQVTLFELDSDHALLDCLEVIGDHASDFLVS
ncbi:MAG: esterase [Thermodesulfovibrio sp.]|nr:esterase [Thermodesulfovibrio sp.]